MNHDHLLPRTKPTIIVSLALILVIIVLMATDLPRPSLLFFKWIAFCGFVFVASFYLQPKRKSHLEVCFTDPVDLDRPVLGKSSAGLDFRTSNQKQEGHIEIDHVTDKKVLQLNGATFCAGGEEYQKLYLPSKLREPVSLNVFGLYSILALVICPAFRVYIHRDDWILVDLAIIAALITGLVILFRENSGSRKSSIPIVDDHGKISLPRRDALKYLENKLLEYWPILVGFILVTTIVALQGVKTNFDISIVLGSIKVGGTFALYSALGAGLVCGIACVINKDTNFPLEIFILLFLLILIRLSVATDYLEKKIAPPKGNPSDWEQDNSYEHRRY